MLQSAGIVQSAPSSTLFQWTLIDHETSRMQLDENLKEHFTVLSSRLQGLSDSETLFYLQTLAASAPIKHEEVQGALLYGILTHPHTKLDVSKKYDLKYKSIYSVLVCSF